MPLAEKKNREAGWQSFPLAVCLLCLLMPTSAQSENAPTGPQRQGGTSTGVGPKLLAAAGESLNRMFEESAGGVVVVDSPPITSAHSGWGGENQEAGSHNADAEGMSETGSGIVFTEDGHILTNYHVIENAAGDEVRVKTRDGVVRDAKIIGTDYKTDLAVLKIPGPPPPKMKKGDSDRVKTGHLVGAIGAPYGLEYTFTLGVVSGRGRNPLTASAYEDYIQTDAAINPGNSGGPLINMDGEWIGINTLMNGINRGLGFSIPSNQAEKIGMEIIARGSVVRPWIGIRASRPEGMAVEEGIGVDWVGEGSPAARSGIREGDLIIKVNGVRVTTPALLQKEIWNTKVGDKMVVEFIRGGKVRERVIETIAMPEVDR